jgi:hypothetical protein
MPSYAILFGPLKGAKADPKAHVRLHGNVHLPGPPAVIGLSNWTNKQTPCGRKYKHHDRERNRRTDEPLDCLLCLMEDVGA